MNLPGGRRPQPQPALIARPALTAAATEPGARNNGTRGASRLRRLHQDWQVRALATYDTVGECWYPSQFYARSMAKTRYFPALLNDKGEPEEQETGPLVDLFERIRDPGASGRSELAASYGRLQFLNGDGYLTVSETEDGDEAWEYLSVAELRIDPNDQPGKPQSYRRLRAPSGMPEELSEADDNDFQPLTGSKVNVRRLWRPHPAHTDLADAPIRAVLDLYELLHRLTLAAAAEASSRAAQRGMLVVAREIADSLGVAPDDDPLSHPFIRALAEGFASAISNPGTPEAMAPFVVLGPAGVPGPDNKNIPITDLIRWIPLGPTDRYLEGEMWEKTIERIGNGLDLPREFLTGMAEGNHWTGWLVDEQGYRQHIAPVTERFCGDLAAAYLRPAAKADNFKDWERVVVGYDPADAILHPDQVGTAKDAHDRLVISDAAYLDAAGYTDEDAPDEAELERRTKVLLKVDPYAPAAPEPTGETPPTEGGTGGDVVEAPPPTPTQNGSTPNGEQPAPAVTAAALQAAKILGAAEMQIERARERAGAQLVRRSQSCVECRDKIELVPQSLVAAALGQELVHQVINGHTTEAALISGVGAGLANKLRAWGIHGDLPDQLGRIVEEHAVRTLYDDVPPPLPPAFQATIAKALR